MSTIPSGAPADPPVPPGLSPTGTQVPTLDELIAEIENNTSAQVAQEVRSDEELARLRRVDGAWDALRRFRSFDLQDIGDEDGSFANREQFIDALLRIGESVRREGMLDLVPARQPDDPNDRALAIELLQTGLRSDRSEGLTLLTRIVRHADGCRAIAYLKDELRREVLGVQPAGESTPSAPQHSADQSNIAPSSTSSPTTMATQGEGGSLATPVDPPPATRIAAGAGVSVSPSVAFGAGAVSLPAEEYEKLRVRADEGISKLVPVLQELARSMPQQPRLPAGTQGGEGGPPASPTKKVGSAAKPRIPCDEAERLVAAAIENTPPAQREKLTTRALNKVGSAAKPRIPCDEAERLVAAAIENTPPAQREKLTARALNEVTGVSLGMFSKLPSWKKLQDEKAGSVRSVPLTQGIHAVLADPSADAADPAEAAADAEVLSELLKFAVTDAERTRYEAMTPGERWQILEQIKDQTADVRRDQRRPRRERQDCS